MQGKQQDLPIPGTQQKITESSANLPAAPAQSMSERFMVKVVSEFGSGVGELALTEHQKRLAQNYFMALDAALKLAEEKRLKKSEQYRDLVPITWQNVNMSLLARNVVSAARIGWDALEKNHVHLVPYKNNTTGQYDVGFLPGYRGLELKAEKYALGEPPVVTCELVFSTDEFKIIKKDHENKFDSYTLKVTNPFDRGAIVGGFYYHAYKDKTRNKLVVMSMKDIEKRKPKHASPEFWGGEKDAWVKDEKTGKNKKSGKEKVEGWFEEMCLKTIKRAAYGNITIDSQKIDDAYQVLQQNEVSVREAESQMTYEEEANKDFIDIETGEITKEEEPVTTPENTPPQGNEPPPADIGPAPPEAGGMTSEEADRALMEEEAKIQQRKGRAPF